MNKSTVLYIDDDQSQLRSFTRVFSEKFNILCSETGEDGLKVFKENESKISVVLLDIRLGGMSGFEVFEEIKKINYKIPVIFITGYQDHYADGYEIYKKYRPHGYIIKNHEQENRVIEDTLYSAIESYKNILKFDKKKLEELYDKLNESMKELLL